jgi:hypothetical protein
MKKSDVAMVILVAAISIGIAFGVVSSLPGLKLPDKAVPVKTIEKYSSNIADPDPEIFNKSAINPTVDITIGGGTSPDGN